MAVTPAPTTEIGTTNPGASLDVPGWGSMAGRVDELEKTPALQWPTSVRDTYPVMRNDSQVEALYYATVLPIRRYRWMIDPNGADPAIVAKVAADYGLPIKGEPAGNIARSGGRFSFADHLRLALEALLSGGEFFEQVCQIGPDGLVHLRKLAPRASYTIEEINTAPDGGLRWIRQTFGQSYTTPPKIDVSRLVAYVWDQTPGRWIGRSMLRSVYREWTLKDRLLRVDTVKHERNGLGMPVTKATVEDVSPEQLAAAQQVAAAWRVGQHASATLPYGTDVELKGVTGNLPDTLASIERHDQAMSKRWLGMLIDLGNTPNGSRALGDTHADLIELGRDAIATWVCDVFNEHVIEDDVDWNYGPEVEFCPRLAYERDPGEQPVEAPPVVTPAAVPSVPLGAPATARRKRGKMFAASRAKIEEPTPLRRELFDHEAAAATDFEAVDAVYRSQLEQLLDSWEDVTSAEIDDLVAQIRGAGSLEALAQIQATATGSVVLAEAMLSVAAAGADQARAEARAQGVDVDEPNLDATEASLEQRAVATDVLLARSLSEASGRRALALAGGATDNDAIADQVRDHLEGLSQSYLVDRLGGAVQTAQNYGRAAAMAEAEAAAGGARYYASEILDENTCSACAAIDGQEFADYDDMKANYATGGYVLCDGGERCRGTAVAVYAEDN